jgi:retinol dehydrogenase 12
MNVSGKNILVTGSNTGIGRVTAEELAKRGAHVILGCRTESKTQPVIDTIRAAGGSAEFLELDLSDFTKVRASAERYLASGKPLDLLINNAGLAGPTNSLSADGFERTFATNHLGHYLLTRLLLPLLEKSDGPRVINVSSKSHFRAHGIDWDTLRKPTATVTGMPEYEVSKLANVLFTKELARRHPKVITTSLHPGVVASDAWRQVPWGFRHLMKAFMITNEEGARTTLHCATGDDIKSGAYYDKQRETKPNKLADDEALAKTLWEKSAEWVGLPV